MVRTAIVVLAAAAVTVDAVMWPKWKKAKEAAKKAAKKAAEAAKRAAAEKAAKIKEAAEKAKAAAKAEVADFKRDWANVKAILKAKMEKPECANPDQWFDSSKLSCTKESRSGVNGGTDVSCTCPDGSMPSAVKCEPNACGGAFDTSCYGEDTEDARATNKFLTESFIPEFIPCCNTHDEGYCAAGSKKLQIDDEFEVCMHDVCKGKSGLERAKCHVKAQIAAAAVRYGGLKAFTAVQANSLTCN